MERNSKLTGQQKKGIQDWTKFCNLFYINSIFRQATELPTVWQFRPEYAKQEQLTMDHAEREF